MEWIEVAVRVARSRVDLAGDLLLRHCPQGFSEGADDRDGRRVLCAYLPAGAAGRTALGELKRALSRAAVAGGRPEASARAAARRATVRARVVTDAEWADAWKAFARPINIGRLTVQPTWMARPAAGRQTVVRLDPGMAFGSGEHASTQLCLHAIDRYVGNRATVIDLGTGSGILAIAAARLGAARVLAIDNDPVAVAVARANIRANRVARQVVVRRGQGLARVRSRADLIVANLTAEILPSILPDVPRCLTPGGRFVASGFSGSRLAGVRAQIVKSGLRVVATGRLQEWRAVHAAVDAPALPPTHRFR